MNLKLKYENSIRVVEITEQLCLNYLSRVREIIKVNIYILKITDKMTQALIL